MGAFSRNEVIVGNPELIPAIASEIHKEFAKDGYEVVISNLVSGGMDISLTKGNLFKAVLGMRTALKITLTPQIDSIKFEANVGIFGQQIIPSITSWFYLWPVLLTQIWGLVKQSNIDDKALGGARRVIYNGGATSVDDQTVKYCPSCGTPVPSADTKFCVNCGKKL